MREVSVYDIKWWCVSLDYLTFLIKLWIVYIVGFSPPKCTVFLNLVVSSVPLNHTYWLYEKREKICLRSIDLFWIYLFNQWSRYMCRYQHSSRAAAADAAALRRNNQTRHLGFCRVSYNCIFFTHSRFLYVNKMWVIFS